MKSSIGYEKLPVVFHVFAVHFVLADESAEPRIEQDSIYHHITSSFGSM